ncbi:hypothetical protein SAMN06272737_12464 [Blastococcus mobilis]|uniref:Uncharacterized protein n=1 Tax=Blastococcus mobilis TaxID=1938746 RepID=A0A238Z428_9ACTN|nr:hypothetical protein SAMN06272737_12464 [Blastococcus mobilis]
MAWWVWLLVAWLLLAVLVALLAGRGLQIAENREWSRRGKVDRRSRPREIEPRRSA